MNKPSVDSLIEELTTLIDRVALSTTDNSVDINREGYRSPSVPTHDHARIALYRIAELIRIRRQSELASSTDETIFNELLDAYSTETIYVHIGLKDIHRAFEHDPYEFVLHRLEGSFENILAAGFTPSFRTSEEAVYNKSTSEPHFGAFTQLFLENADYRTNDATNSILVKGDYHFDDCNHRRSFDKNGCFGKLDADDVLYANIGTDRLVCSQLHYIEHVLDVPYLQTNTYEGTIYYDDDTYEPITQYSDAYAPPAVWNREKIEADLLRAGILDRYNLNGLYLRFFQARELREFIASKIDTDPYYLVTL